jgi:hypothetical protein
MDPNAVDQTGLVKKYWWVPRQQFIQDKINAGNTHAHAHFLASMAARRPGINGKPPFLLLLKEEVLPGQRNLTIHIIE